MKHYAILLLLAGLLVLSNPPIAQAIKNTDLDKDEKQVVLLQAEDILEYEGHAVGLNEHQKKQLQSLIERRRQILSGMKVDDENGSFEDNHVSTTFFGVSVAGTSKAAEWRDMEDKIVRKLIRNPQAVEKIEQFSVAQAVAAKNAKAKYSSPEIGIGTDYSIEPQKDGSTILTVNINAEVDFPNYKIHEDKTEVTDEGYCTVYLTLLRPSYRMMANSRRRSDKVTHSLKFDKEKKPEYFELKLRVITLDDPADIDYSTVAEFETPKPKSVQVEIEADPDSNAS